ncbi:MAG: DUF4143 domain-containing protein [Lachnospiraceae bacterium]|jgi:predicted AAA+ superfamily ATPase|nr:DUF4143 domain-containing protein [Lachnospiraceae bacterium]
MEYIRRVVDTEIDRRTEAFNAISIVGPKGCGKTRTAKERSKTVIEFQDEEKRDGYLSVAESAPNLLLMNKKPILLDEWQDAPKMWGAVRKACDDEPDKVGEYFMTGSVSKQAETPHTGTGRISQVTMYPMTLAESGESNGQISIAKLVEDPDSDIDGIMCDLSLPDLFYAACRGGWPRCLSIKSRTAKLEIARDYYRQIYNKDISAVDNVTRNPEWARTLLWSYARNMATTAKKSGIYADVKANFTVSDATLASYIDALERLYVIRDIDAWTPQIRSKTAIRNARKHIFTDQSIGLAALGISPDYFNNDLDLFGHVLENMVIRDLLVSAEAHDARILHYTDDMGLEADAIYQMNNGSYGLIEIKTGTNQIPAAEKSLLKFRDIIKKHNEAALKNEKHPRPVYREPSALIIICATAQMAFSTKNGIKVVPVGCLGD